MKIIAKRVKNLREGIDVSQRRLAKEIGVTQASVYRYENDLADIPAETLVWYANYFNVSLDYIFGRTDNPQGKLFKFQPEVIKERANQNENLKAFVNMCFDPKSAMNERLKNALFEILSKEKENQNL